MGSSDLQALTGQYFNQRLNETIRNARIEQWDDDGFNIPPDRLLEDIEPSTADNLSFEDWESNLVFTKLTRLNIGIAA